MVLNNGFEFTILRYLSTICAYDSLDLPLSYPGVDGISGVLVGCVVRGADFC